MIPIIVIFKGNPSYLKYVIKQAEKMGNYVILGGDLTNKALCKNWFNIEDYNKGQYLREFKEKYVHMCNIPFDVVYTWCERHFIVYEYAIEHDIDQFIIMDGDVLVYDSFDDKYFEEYDCASSWITKESTISPHFTYMKTNIMENFLKFCIYMYTDKLDVLQNRWKTFIDNKKSGGNDDMTLFYYWREIGGQVMYNLAYDGFNHSMSAEASAKQGYDTDNILKIIKIKFIDDKPYAYRNGKRTEMKILHTQGNAKSYIKLLYKCSNNTLWYYIAKLNTYRIRMINHFRKR